MSRSNFRVDAEFKSVVAFAEWKIDNDDPTFTGADLQTLNRVTLESVPNIKLQLIDLGLTQAIPEKVAKVRGFTANSHDRWAGNPCAGGSGGSSIRSFAGNAAGWN